MILNFDLLGRNSSQSQVLMLFNLTLKYAATAALALAITEPAGALPLLAESAALNEGAALTLYPDHLDKSKYYFMPNSSKIGRDEKGVPTFSFTYYGLTNPAPTSDAGALMVYVGKLTSDPDQAQAMANFLKSHQGAGIAVLPIQESTISLTASNGKPSALAPFFSEFDFSQHGGRAEDEIGINAILTGTGARVFRASLNSEAGAALKWDMCYKVQGLGPSMDGQITVKMNRVYDHFAAQASGGMYWWRASISTEIEKLVKSKDVSWTINGGDAKDEDYLREVVNTIVARMFKPELNMSPAGTTIWEKVTPFSFGASYTHKEENDLEQWTITRRDLVTREFCVPLVIKDIQDFKNQCVIDADKN